MNGVGSRVYTLRANDKLVATLNEADYTRDTGYQSLNRPVIFTYQIPQPGDRVEFTCEDSSVIIYIRNEGYGFWCWQKNPDQRSHEHGHHIFYAGDQFEGASVVMEMSHDPGQDSFFELNVNSCTITVSLVYVP